MSEQRLLARSGATTGAGEASTVDETAAPVLDVRGVTQRFDRQVAVDDFSLQVSHGELVSLLGPSGCGKSTILRVIAGLQVPDAGRVEIRGRPVADTATGTMLPPEQRDIGMVFQSYAIWPHMTVFDNVAFPLRLRRVPRAEKKARVMEVLAATGLEQVASKPATRLSGGQQQRVALARALVFRPSLMLLDEPLSNLDAQLREQMRIEIRRLQRDFDATAIFVTHDQEEAMSLSDRIAVMRDGRLEQIGTPHDLYTAPCTPFVRDFLGHVFSLTGTLVRGKRTAVAVDATDGSVQVPVADVSDELRDGQSVVLTCRPEDVTLRADDSDAAANAIVATVLDATYLGATIQYRLAVGPSEVVLWSPKSDNYAVGSQVRVLPDTENLSVWSA